MRKLLLLLLPILLAFFLVSCEDTTTEPEAPGVGSISLSSTPTGATILINNNPTGKTTPAVITDLDAGNISVTLQLTNYKDTTFTMTVTANMETPKHVNLSQNAPELETFTAVKIYEVASNNLSGIDLSTGSVTASTGSATDIFFEGASGSRDIKSQHLRSTTTTNQTHFYVGTSTNLEDGTDSPLYQSSDANWRFDNNNTQNYVFLYDKDSHYSKLRITSTGQDGPFDRYVIITFIYNKLINDVRF